MRLYDKTYVKYAKGSFHVFRFAGTDNPVTGWFAEKENQICMTIEELREVWAMAKSGPDYPGVFELFLKSKGIIQQP